MSYHSKRESRTEIVGENRDKNYQQMSNDSNDISGDQNSKDSTSLPKYYPKDHEVTRWLINQMRCRNGLHHLVNLINIQPSLLSAYFEVYDQPELYIDEKTGPGMPAYGIKTVLYLTPLAIAIYLRLKSVLHLLLDSSRSRIHARARNEVDVNAICYVRRIKPRPSPFINDEYSTTQPAIIAIRREFFPAISLLLMTSNFNPQSPVYVTERLGTSRETTCWFVDILDFCIKLLNNRPGLDVISFLQCINCRVSTYDNFNNTQCFYDPCVYDVKQINDNTDKDESNKYIWCSVFRRLLRKGVHRSYSNCGNRLISLLEYIIEVGFFRQTFMPKGIINYDTDLLTNRYYTSIGFKKITPQMINNLTGSEKDNATSFIAADRDICLYLLTLWLERVRSRCLDRQAQRLFRLLTTSLAETELLHDFLFPPENINTTNTTLYPYWLSVNLTKKQSLEQHLFSIDCLEEDTNEMCELEPAQLNEIRNEVGLLAHSLNLIDYSEKLYPMVEYPKLTKTLPINGAFGDIGPSLNDTNAVYVQKKSNSTRSRFLTSLSGKLLEESMIKNDNENKCNNNNIRTSCLLGHYNNNLLLSPSSSSHNQWAISGLNDNTLKCIPKIERKSRSIQNRMYCMNRTRTMSMSPCSTSIVNTPSPIIDTKMNTTQQTTNYQPTNSLSEHLINSQLKPSSTSSPSSSYNSNEITRRQSNINVEVQVDSINKSSPKLNDYKNTTNHIFHSYNKRVLKQMKHT